MEEGEQDGVSSSDTASDSAADSTPAAASIHVSACPQGKGGVHDSSILPGVVCLRRTQFLSPPCTLHLLLIPHMSGEAQELLYGPGAAVGHTTCLEGEGILTKHQCPLHHTSLRRSPRNTTQQSCLFSLHPCQLHRPHLEVVSWGGTRGLHLII